MKWLANTLLLPASVSAFESNYLWRLNRIGFVFFAMHVPLFTLLAWLNKTGPGLAFALSSAALVGPAVALRTYGKSAPRRVSLVHGVTSMLMGGVLVHVGQGPMQIEMHFYFFALIAMLSIFGNPLVILAAATTVALHHLVLWLVLPSSVFNYEAAVWVVVVHAAFVVLESVAACFIARSFFDNVIGLERILQARTSDLDGRNRDMRLVLDNAEQGFITLDRDGKPNAEKSAVVHQWFGPLPANESIFSSLNRLAPGKGDLFVPGWDQLFEDVFPVEVALAQLPTRLGIKDRLFQLHWIPINNGAALDKVLLVVSDVTESFRSAHLEATQTEMMRVFQNLLRDRQGFLDFFEEGCEQLAIIEHGLAVHRESTVLRRAIHTLKGNAGLFELASVAKICHDLESALDEGCEPEQPGAQRAMDDLRARWIEIEKNVKSFVGDQSTGDIAISMADYDTLLQAALSTGPRDNLVNRLTSLKQEPVSRRLDRAADQAAGLAKRLGKGDIRVEVDAHPDVRATPKEWKSFWAAFVHVVRNAVDHGLESPEERVALMKSPQGVLKLSARVEGDSLVIEASDDGRGIDWESVRLRARAAGLPCTSPDDLVEALFTDGLSTAKAVGDVSGRGIGMSAVRAACTARGGTVAVQSVRGQGATMQFRFQRELNEHTNIQASDALRPVQSS